VYKTKSAKADNPHIAKRRNHKKLRRLSAAFHKATFPSNRDVDSTHNKTPEESICSNDVAVPHVNTEDRDHLAASYNSTNLYTSYSHQSNTTESNAEDGGGNNKQQYGEPSSSTKVQFKS
jgi:hypothetical protein